MEGQIKKILWSVDALDFSLVFRQEQHLLQDWEAKKLELTWEIIMWRINLAFQSFWSL